MYIVFMKRIANILYFTNVINSFQVFASLKETQEATFLALSRRLCKFKEAVNHIKPRSRHLDGAGRDRRDLGKGSQPAW